MENEKEEIENISLKAIKIPTQGNV